MKAKQRRILSLVFCVLLTGSLLPFGVFAQDCAHNYVPDSAVVPTCTTGGYTLFRCTLCGDTYEGEPIPALGHRYPQAWESYDADQHEKICSRCGDTVREAHVWVLDAQLSREATEDYSGFAVYNCSRCNDQKTETIPQLTHQHSFMPIRTAATCTEGGYTTYICYTCNTSYVADETPALGHDWDEGTITKQPTCTATGRRRCTCRRDSSHISISEVPALGHDWDDGVLTTPPTTEQEGVLTCTCARCGETTVQTIRKRVPGDANADNLVDLRDVVSIRRTLADWDGYSVDEYSADVNGNDAVDLRDAALIVRYLAGWEVELL